MKKLILLVFTTSTVGCATLTNDPMTPISISFSDGSNGECRLQNKRGAWETKIPTTFSVRRSDDSLTYDCTTSDGRKAFGSMASTVSAKLLASVLFLDLGITDAITDKHREYPASYVIPIQQKE